jgi:aspartokinase/homoserine dehydrogenase 1
LFAAGLNVVSSNRRSFAVPYVTYASLHAAARENGAFFRYETTVGAALPILESISRGANSCDQVLSIEAVVSCTLNQILSEYRPGGESFASLVRKAQEAGLTEPDPRMDLGGRDALRKLLILAREAGVRLEEEDVQVAPVIPEALFNVPLDRFYQDLEAVEPAFAEATRSAETQGFRRRFVASLEKTEEGYRAGIGIRNVPPVHPAYHLKGTENAIIVRSAFHPYPLVIQGPGEGAREAASSILNDILR